MPDAVLGSGVHYTNHSQASVLEDDLQRVSSAAGLTLSLEIAVPISVRYAAREKIGSRGCPECSRSGDLRISRLRRGPRIKHYHSEHDSTDANKGQDNGLAHPPEEQARPGLRVNE